MFKTSREISDFVLHYLNELDGLDNRKRTKGLDRRKWEPPKGEWVKVNFDARQSHFQIWFRNSGSGLRRSSVHEYVSIAFAAEALATLAAVKTGLEIGLQHVILESNSLSVIKKNLLQANRIPQNSAYIRDI